MGGPWSLAGFAYQFRCYLSVLFARLEQQDEQYQLPAMEQLSDILDPHVDYCRIIQVKLTLTKAKLGDVLAEAYYLTEHVLAEKPDLIDFIRFQIICDGWDGQRAEPKDIDMNDVIKEGMGHKHIWNRMLVQFDEQKPIRVGIDQLSTLYSRLWQLGIKEPKEFIEQCNGKLLESFHNPAQDSSNVEQELEKLFQNLRDPTLKIFGRFLTRADFRRSKNVPWSGRELISREPGLDSLRDGRFFPRSSIMSELSSRFSQWLHDLTPDAERVPVFFIEGRRGDGKSVALLQLANNIVDLFPGVMLFHVNKQGQLPELIKSAEQLASSLPPGKRIYFLVDDLFSSTDQEEWLDRLKQAIKDVRQRIALITCGTSVQKECFAAQCRTQVSVTPYLLRPPQAAELRDIVAWYNQRTGANRPLEDFIAVDKYLVQFFFELARGVHLGTFADNMRRDLSKKNYERVRTIFAADCLDLPVPLALFPDNEDLSDLVGLSKELPLTFHDGNLSSICSSNYIQPSHPILSRAILEYWHDGRLSIEEDFALELEKLLQAFLKQDDTSMAETLLKQLLHYPYQCDSTTGDFLAMPEQKSLINHIYAVHLRSNSDQPAIKILGRWIELSRRIANLGLSPEPLEFAVKIMENLTDPSKLTGLMVSATWLISEQRPNDEAMRISALVRSSCERYPDTPGIAHALARIASLSGHRNASDLRDYLSDWLKQNPGNRDAYSLASQLLSNYPADARVFQNCLSWARKAVENNPNVGDVIKTLLKTNNRKKQVGTRSEATRHATQVKELALEWLNKGDNWKSVQGFPIIAALLNAHASCLKVVELALEWVRHQESNYQTYGLAHQVLEPLVRSGWREEEVLNATFKWIKAQTGNPHIYLVWRPLVKKYPERYSQQAFEWLVQN